VNVTGKLIGTNSAPVAGVKVHILDGKSTISTSPPSSADGTFSCTVVEQWYDKPLVLQINAPGYLLFQRDLRIQDGAGPYDYDLLLTPSAQETPLTSSRPPFLKLALLGVAAIAFIGVAWAARRQIFSIVRHHSPPWHSLEWPAGIAILIVAVIVYRKMRKPTKP